MTKAAPRRSKKEEQKKLMVRITCLVLAVALIVTSVVAIFSSFFQDNSGYTTYTIDDLVAMGLIEVDEEGNITFVDGALTGETDDHDHDHEDHDHD